MAVTRRRLIIRWVIGLGAAVCVLLLVHFVVSIGLGVLASGSVEREFHWSPDGVLQSAAYQSWLGQSGACVTWDSNGAVIAEKSGHYMAGYRYRALSDSELASYATGEQRIECDLRSIMNAAHAFRAGHGSSFPSSWEALFSDPGSRAQLPDARSSIKDPWGHAYHYKSGLSAAWIELYTLGRDDREGGSDQDADHVLIADGDSPAVYAGTLR